MSERMKTCALAFAFLLVVGCTAPDSTAEALPEETEVQASANNELPEQSWGVRVFTDSNGCQYIVYSVPARGGITPRMNPDGTQICQEPSNG